MIRYKISTNLLSLGKVCTAAFGGRAHTKHFRRIPYKEKFVACARKSMRRRIAYTASSLGRGDKDIPHRTLCTNWSACHADISLLLRQPLFCLTQYLQQLKLVFPTRLQGGVRIQPHYGLEVRIVMN
jgi:hypothetical protein